MIYIYIIIYRYSQHLLLRVRSLKTVQFLASYPCQDAAALAVEESMKLAKRDEPGNRVVNRDP